MKHKHKILISFCYRNSITQLDKSQFKIMLKGICSKVQKNKPECLNLSNNFSEEFYNDIANLNPDVHCPMIGMCSEKLDHDSSTIHLEKSINEYEFPLPECKICEKVIKKAQKEIGRDKSRVNNN